MLSRKRVVSVVLLAALLFVAVGFPTMSMMAGLSQPVRRGASQRGSSLRSPSLLAGALPPRSSASDRFR